MMKRRVFVLAAVLALIAALFTLSAFAADNVRYVANAAMGDGDGSTAANATTLQGAFQYFSDNYFTNTDKAGETCTIYLVEDVMLTRLYNPGGDRTSYLQTCYAEHAHAANPVEIKSAPGGEKAAIIFPLTGVSGTATVPYYFLNGDTTFDNVILRVQSTNTTNAVISARGHKLTLGAGVETDVNGSGKKISVVGGYVNGGYYPISGATSPIKFAYDADVAILNGEYDTICALNYTNVAVVADSTAKLTLGNVTVGTLSSANFSGAVNENTEVNVYYTGALDADAFYLAKLASTDSKDRAFNHFLMKGSSLSEETLAAAQVSYIGASSLNIYFDPSNADVEASARALYVKFATSVGNFGYGSLTDYELANGGHTVGADGKCTFCGVVPCESDDEHTAETAYITEATCSAGGLEYTRCSKCYKMLSAITVGAPDESKHVLDGAVWETAADGNSLIRKCASCGNTVDTYPVATDGSVAVYVSASGDPNGGESAAHPIDTLVHAQDFAAKLADIYYGADDTTTPVTIYVIGKVDIPNARKVSSSELNTFNNCFEETKHIDHPFVFTSAEGAERGELHFSLSGSTMAYLLYGPTTFENLSFSGKVGGHSIIGRGFKLVMGEGLEMIDISGKIKKSATAVVEVSDLKLYVVGGWYGSSSALPLYEERQETSPIDTDLTILSGEYWFVGTFNRSVKVISDSTGTLTVGSPKIVYLSSVSTGNAELSNVTANIHYTGAAQINDLYLGTQNPDSGSAGYTTNQFFHPGCESMSVAVTYDTYRDVVNLYYYNKQTVKGTAETIIGSKIMNETMTFTEYCVTYRGGHTYDANDICDFCGVKKCTEHTPSEWVVDVVPTCTETGHRYQYCTVCYEQLADEALDKDGDNHDYLWTWNSARDQFVYQCTRCDKILLAYTGELENKIYVSDKGFASGGLTAASPINDLTAAYNLAINVAGVLDVSEVTIYLVGETTIPIDDLTPYYIAPSHEGIHITIEGYGSNAAKLVYGGHYAAVSGSTPRVEYALGGDTTFDKVEFSSGKNTCPIYLTARHYHLTLGEQVSCDFQRNAGGGEAHGGALTVVGGCYGTRLGACTKTDTHLTIKSGTFRNIITGSSSTSCGLANGTCTLELLGNVISRESIFGGSSGGNAGNVVITINGDATAARYFVFGCSGTSCTAKNVKVILETGTISSGSFNALTGSNQIIAPVGCANATDIFSGISGSLIVFYDPSDPSSVEMQHRVAQSPASRSVEYLLISDRCEVSSDGMHHHASGATPIEDSTHTSQAATCFSDGYNWYECSSCHQIYAEAVSAEHTFSANPDKNTAADCIHAGTKAYTCTKCGYTKYEIDASAPATGVHSYGDDGVCTVCHYSVAADCAHEHLGELYTETTKCGTVTKQKCADCGLAITVASTGSHNWGAYTVTVEPTDTAPGIKTRKCKDCGKIETALLYANDTSLATDPVAVDQSGNLVDFAIASSKLTSSEKAALNALLQDSAYGSEVKVSYTTDGTTVTNVTYSIPLPDEYSDYENVKVVVKDDDGNLHTVDFKVEKGYIVFTF